MPREPWENGEIPADTMAVERLHTDIVEVERLRATTPPPEPMIENPTVGAAWTVIDHFRSQGRRYVVAVEKPAATRLSAAERKVLRLAAVPSTNKEIASELGLAHATVKVLLHRAAAKLGVRTRAELIEAFRQQG